MNERLIAAYLPHNDIVLLPKLVTLMNDSPYQNGNEQYK